jgi:hypothetical protein
LDEAVTESAGFGGSIPSLAIKNSGLIEERDYVRLGDHLKE